MEICALTADLNRYEIQQTKRLAQLEALEQRAAEIAEDLMQPGQYYYPFREKNLFDLTENVNLRDVLQLLARKQYEDAGALLHTRLIAFAEKLALAEATAELEGV